MAALNTAEGENEFTKIKIGAFEESKEMKNPALGLPPNTRTAPVMALTLEGRQA